jgi:hypothetical protein
MRPAVVADRSHVVVLDSLPHPAAVANGGTLSLLDGFGRGGRGLGYAGEGVVHAPYRADEGLGAGVTIRGVGLQLHHRAPRSWYFRYAEGGAPARDLARRSRARSQVREALAGSAAALAADLAAADTAARGDLVVRHVRAFGHLIRAARLPAADLAALFARHVNPALVAQGRDLPLLFHRLHAENPFLDYEFWRAHRATFSAEQLRRIDAFAELDLAATRRGADPAAVREESLAFLNAFPPGSALHGRAMDAAERGESLAGFRQVLAAEAEAARRAAQLAEIARLEREAYLARLQAEAEAARRRQEELARNPPAPTVNWASAFAVNLSSSSSYQAYRPSETRQLSDFSRRLDNAIHNVGRDYGQGRRY